MSICRAIDRADSLLPGTPAPEGKRDRRWQAIIRVGEYIESSPEEVWQFARRWGTHRQQDLRDAIACCLLEHLLEYHFDLIFPRVKQAAVESKLFADTFTACWKFGQSEIPKNSRKFDRLQAWCVKRQQPVKRTRKKARQQLVGVNRHDVEPHQ
jgi:hypothetical protein